jgi:hypothetical protein
VQIPQGDFSKDKNIINKKTLVIKETKKFTFSQFVKTANLFSSSAEMREYTLHISGQNARAISFVFNGPFIGYTRFGIQAAIKAELTNVIKGDYGLQIELIGYD